MYSRPCLINSRVIGLTALRRTACKKYKRRQTDLRIDFRVIRHSLILLFCALSIDQVIAQEVGDTLCFTRADKAKEIGTTYVRSIFCLEEPKSTFIFKSYSYMNKREAKGNLVIKEEEYIGKWTINSDTLKLCIDKPTVNKGDVLRFLLKGNKAYFIPNFGKKTKKYPWKKIKKPSYFKFE